MPVLKAAVVRESPPCPNELMHSALTWFTQAVNLAEAMGLPMDAGTMAACLEPAVVSIEVAHHQLNRG